MAGHPITLPGSRSTLYSEIRTFYGLKINCPQSGELSSLYRKVEGCLYCSAQIPLLYLQLKNPEWAPDFGLPEFDRQWGATVTGARQFLIAYNVNIMGTKEQAHRIALDIRTIGRGPNEVSGGQNLESQCPCIYCREDC